VGTARLEIVCLPASIRRKGDDRQHLPHPAGGNASLMNGFNVTVENAAQLSSQS
jgi:hypothetical protein